MKPRVADDEPSIRDNLASRVKLLFLTEKAFQVFNPVVNFHSINAPLNDIELKSREKSANERRFSSVNVTAVYGCKLYTVYF